MAINKIIYSGTTLIDLTGDTVSTATLLSGATAHDNSGTVITGECTYDADTSDATAVVAEILATKTAYSNGSKLTGTGSCTYDSDTSQDDAVVAEVLVGKTFHARGAGLTGTMPNNGAVTGTISTKNGTYTIPQGYHDGSGSVGISSTERNKIVAGNIKNGIQILGVTGTYGGEAVSVQAKTATPTSAQQVITPDTGYDYLSQVTVKAIPYVESANAYGTTVTIG